MFAILTSGGSVDVEIKKRVGGTGVANAETGKDNFFIAGSSVGSRPGNWSFFNEMEFVGGQGVPVFVPEVGDEAVVVRFEVVGWK